MWYIRLYIQAHAKIRKTLINTEGDTMNKKPIKRDPKVVERFLKKEGLIKIPKGKEVDHIKPLVDGGSDTVRNLQLLTENQHKIKTTREAKERAKKK